jgi:hypothetical protein
LLIAELAFMPRARLSSRLADLMAPSAVAEGIDSPTPHSVQIACSLAQSFGPATLAVILYGSHARRADARSDSLHDFFIVTDDYRRAFDHLRAVGATSLSPSAATMLAHWLPPNVIAATAGAPGKQPPAKCAVLSREHFLEETSAPARDHFTQGRLFQCVRLAWARDAAAAALVTRALVATRMRTIDWARPYLPEIFDVESYLRSLLETSFAAEIRPEAADRVKALLDAQLPLLHTAYGAVLEALAAAGELERFKTGYRLGRPVSVGDRQRVRRYFSRSKRRSTLRWAKHVVLYEDWLTYIVRKIERRSGMQIQLTAREQRWPLIFIWPRAIRFILTRPQKGGE